MNELHYEYDDEAPFDDDAAGAGPLHHLIRASAGAGKTYQLTQHVLKLLRRGAALDTILATTFTRKAAGEILGRIITTLAEQADDPGSDPAEPGEKSARLLLSELTLNLHRVAVSTIDSFFHRLGSSFQYELDLPLEPRLMDEGSAAATQLRAEAIEAVLADAAADDQTFIALLALLRRLHHDQASRSVTRAIDQIVVDHAEVFRRAPDAQTWSQLKAVGLLDDSSLNEAIENWRQMKPHLPTTKAGTPRANWNNSWIKIGQQAAAGDWDNIASVGLLGALLANKEKFDRVEIPDEWIDAALPLLNHARGVLIQKIALQTEATYELMNRFAQRYDRLRRQRGVMLYSDLTHRLARGQFTPQHIDATEDQLLSEIHFRLDRAVTHLLLDEFQDTSLDQWAVLDPFAQEVAAASDGSRSLFVVGDTKQAIYGWRGGCVELFDTVEGLVPPEGWQTLAESRRSSPIVLDAVNTVFADLAGCPTLNSEKYPEDADAAALWSERFEPHRAFHDKLPGFVSFEVSDPANADDDEMDRDDMDRSGDDGEDVPVSATSHERFVAERIGELYRTMPGRTVGVLVSTNGAVNRLLYELRRANLPASGEGGNPISDTPAVAAVLSAMQLADHPTSGRARDTAAGFHVLNSPLGPLLDMASARDAERVARDIRRSLVVEGYAATIARWVVGLASDCDAAGLSKLTRLIELAERYEAQPGEALRPSRFVDFIESTRVEEPSNSNIRVMTIHKSKGLEFDAVVLPEIDRKLSSKFAVLIDQPDPTGAIEAVFRYASEATRAASPTLAAVYAQQRGRRRQEDLCSLYVAMTRAKQGLYLIGKPLTTPDGKVRNPGLCFAGILRDTLGDPDGGPITWGDPDWMHRQVKTTSAEMPVKTRGFDASPVLAARLAGDRPAGRMRPTVSPSQMHGQGKVSVAELFNLASPQAKQHGTEVHAILERVDYLDGEQPPDESLPQLKAMFDHAAVRAAFTRRYGAAEQLWRERAFVVPDGKRLLKGKFDRVVYSTDSAGRAAAAHLIDFKTDRVGAEGAQLAERVEVYRMQVEAYRRALSLMLGLDADRITAELLFTTPGVSVGL